jgi:hypothetical protein
VDHDSWADDDEAMEESAAVRAERHRRRGDPAEAARAARDGLGNGDDTAARTALALALLDLGEFDEARYTLETLLETLLGDTASARLAAEASSTDSAHSGLYPDRTLAAATADTLELMGALDAAPYGDGDDEQPQTVDADDVAEQALREVPAEIPDELLPSSGSPFATSTFADLLEKQGHAAEARTLRGALGESAETGQGGSAQARKGRGTSAGGSVAELERWLHNLRSTAS